MTEYQQLVLRLKHLSDKNIETAEFNVDFLKRALSFAVANGNEIMISSAKSNKNIEVDGGNFSDNSTSE